MTFEILESVLQHLGIAAKVLQQSQVREQSVHRKRLAGAQFLRELDYLVLGKGLVLQVAI